MQWNQEGQFLLGTPLFRTIPQTACQSISHESTKRLNRARMLKITKISHDSFEIDSLHLGWPGWLTGWAKLVRWNNPFTFGTEDFEN